MFGIVELLMSVWILVFCQIPDETTLLIKAPGHDIWGVQIKCLSEDCKNKGNDNCITFSSYYCVIDSKVEPNGAGNKEILEIEDTHRLLLIRLHPGEYRIESSKNGNAIIPANIQFNEGVYYYELGKSPAKPINLQPGEDEAIKEAISKMQKENDLEIHTKSNE